MITPHYNDELFPVCDAAGSASRSAREEAPNSGDAPVLRAIRGDARAELSSDHIAEIRQRIRHGAYNAPEIADQVARRLLSSGDLERSRA